MILELFFAVPGSYSTIPRGVSVVPGGVYVILGGVSVVLGAESTIPREIFPVCKPPLSIDSFLSQEEFPLFMEESKSSLKKSSPSLEKPQMP